MPYDVIAHPILCLLLMEPHSFVHVLHMFQHALDGHFAKDFPRHQFLNFSPIPPSPNECAMKRSFLSKHHPPNLS